MSHYNLILRNLLSKENTSNLHLTQIRISSSTLLTKQLCLHHFLRPKQTRITSSHHKDQRICMNQKDILILQGHSRREKWFLSLNNNSIRTNSKHLVIISSLKLTLFSIQITWLKTIPTVTIHSNKSLADCWLANIPHKMFNHLANLETTMPNNNKQATIWTIKLININKPLIPIRLTLVMMLLDKEFLLLNQLKTITLYLSIILTKPQPRLILAIAISRIILMLMKLSPPTKFQKQMCFYLKENISLTLLNPSLKLIKHIKAIYL